MTGGTEHAQCRKQLSAPQRTLTTFSILRNESTYQLELQGSSGWVQLSSSNVLPTPSTPERMSGPLAPILEQVASPHDETNYLQEKV